jgi:hypothetical protein
MELFLNLLWVAIAVVAFGLWRTQWLRGRPENRRNPLREWTAFACALVLLFFVVSLTDDLHSGMVVFDECCASRRHSGAQVCPHHSPQDGLFKQHAGAGVLPAVVIFDAFQGIGTVVPPAGFTYTLLSAPFAPGRAPPADLL